MDWNEVARNFVFTPHSNWTLIWHLLLIKNAFKSVDKDKIISISKEVWKLEVVYNIFGAGGESASLAVRRIWEVEGKARSSCHWLPSFFGQSQYTFFFWPPQNNFLLQGYSSQWHCLDIFLMCRRQVWERIFTSTGIFTTVRGCLLQFVLSFKNKANSLLKNRWVL